MNMRDEFEKWFDGMSYSDRVRKPAWLAWQAAYAAGLRRAAEVCREQIDRSFKQYGDGGDERLIRFGCLRAANAIKQEIECPS
jgi:hypothetical protein